MYAPAHPIRVDGALDRQLSRWLWLLDMGGTDPGSTLTVNSMPEPCDIR